MTTRIEFADLVSMQNGWTPSLVFEQVLTIMAVGEGSKAAFNPIDTILFEPGATPYNSFSADKKLNRMKAMDGAKRLRLRGPDGLLHVWNYPDLATGIKATADTFAGWPEVVKAITSGADVQTVIDAVNAADGDQSNYYTQYVVPVLERWSWEGKRPIVGGSPMTTLAQVQAQILAAAVSQLGVPYVFGGETPGVGFDCSGLTQWSCAQVGVSIPRGSADQFNLSPYQVKDGTFDIADLVFFFGGELEPPRPGHVGLVSDPATLTMIQAPFTGEDVSYAKFDPTITTGALAYFGSTRPALARGRSHHQRRTK